MSNKHRKPSQRPFFVTLASLLLSFTLISCGQHSDSQATASGSIKPDGNFSLALPKALQKVDFTGLEAEVLVTGIGTFSLDVDLDGTGKCGVIGVCGTVLKLPTGSHTFTINYFLLDLNGKHTLVATATATQAISVDATTPIVFPTLINPDEDGDGFSNLKEIELGSDPTVKTSTPNKAPNGVINTPTTDLTILPGQNVNFTATSTDPDNNTPLAFVWNFGGGASNSGLEDPGLVTFNVLGTFSVTFTVSDSTGLSDPTPETRTIIVKANQAPNGVINSPATDLTIFSGQSVNFTATVTDPDNNTPFTFVWNFGGGASNSSLEDPGPVIFNTPGTFTVTFAVSDSAGLSDPTPETRIITVKENQAPNGVMNAPATDQVILKGGSLTFNGSGSDPEGDLGLDFLWNFGGGAADNLFADPGLITFATTGLFPVRMTATDSLGLADPTPAYRVVGVANQRKLSATQIAAGGTHTCAIVDDGRVKCWGTNFHGQLGQGDTADRGDGAAEMGDNLSTVSLGTGRSALALATGNHHTCVLLDDASVKCWGRNVFGQLGQGDTLQRGGGAGEMGDNLSAVSLGVGRTALAISVGNSHTCALLDDASVKCWGRNSSGQLGQGDTLQRGDGVGEMGDNLSAVSLGVGRTALAISAGDSHTCVLLDDASVKCWGRNSTGQLGQGDTLQRGNAAGEMGDNLSAVSLGSGRTALAILAGGAHTCVLLDDASVKCWGDNFFGELGQGDTNNRGDGAGEMGDNLSAVSLGTGHSALAISAGDRHTCALLDDASVKCWGRNSNAQLGQGDTLQRGDGAGEMGDNLPAVSLGTGRSALAISAGSFHTCVLLDDASVKCWGNSNFGQLGQEDVLQRGDGAGEMGDNLPAVSLGTGHSGLAISAGAGHTCALLNNGSVKCWGPNFSGQLGQGDTATRGDKPGEMGNNLSPIDLGTGRSSFAISAGGNHTCTLLNGGSVKCWGSNIFGQLGQGDTFERGDGPGEMGDNLSPIDLGSGRSALAISTGFAHTCALLDDARIKCWGHNGNGQLGQGDTRTRGDGPVEMGGNLSAISLGSGRLAQAIATGSFQTCALLDDGSVKCWGDNRAGQLGQGDTNSRGDALGEMGDNLPPVDLGVGRSALAISVGSDHSCALLDDASVKCWGNNFHGELGQGDRDNRGDGPGEMGDNLSPIDLGTGRSALAISVGSNHSCVLLDNATVKCWGAAAPGPFSGGVLGQGDNFNRGDGPGEMGDNLSPIDLGSGRLALAISAGGAHTCALLDDTSVKCWGSNSAGQLGQGDTAIRGDEPDEMGGKLFPIPLGILNK